MVALRKYFEKRSSSYEIAELPKDSSDVLQIVGRGSDGSVTHEVFFFRRLGAFVCWNVPEAERVKLKLALKDFQIKPYPDELVERENEQLTYLYAERGSKLVAGDVHLCKHADEKTNALEKYAFSNAMALSGRSFVTNFIQMDFIF